MSVNGDFYKDNDYEFEFVVTRKRTADGELEPADGLTGLLAWVSAWDGGATIHADLSVAALPRSGNTNTYFGMIPGSAITERLFGAPSYDGLPVYIRFRGTAQNINVSIPRRAYAVRRPG